MKCHVKEEERVRGMIPTVLDKWLKKATPDDTRSMWRMSRRGGDSREREREREQRERERDMFHVRGGGGVESYSSST